MLATLLGVFMAVILGALRLAVGSFQAWKHPVSLACCVEVLDVYTVTSVCTQRAFQYTRRVMTGQDSSVLSDGGLDRVLKTGTTRRD